MGRSNGESIVPLFPLLSSHDLPTRIDASVSLLSSLALIQSGTSSTVSTPIDSPQAPTSNGGPSSATNSAGDDVDTPYAIKRLVVGLGSTNEASRQGFAVALTELIARLSFAKASTILQQVMDTSAPTGSTDPREERGMLFARLLGIHAVVRSGVLFHPEQRDEEAFKEAILALVQLASRKTWIREPAWWVALEAIRALMAVAPSWGAEAQKWLVQRLLVDSRERARGYSPEKIALVLTLQTSGVQADWGPILAPTFPSGNVLARSSLSALAQALKGAASEGDQGRSSAPKMGSNAVKTSTKAGAPQPGSAPHFVWNEIFDIYFPASGSAPKLAGKEHSAKWNDAWRILVDQALFAPPSLPMKATGFSLLALAMQRLPPADVPALFGDGVVRTFANHLRKTGDTEKTLGRVADKLALSIPPFLANNPSVALPLLKTLVAPPHGAHTFDPKTIDRIVARLDLKGSRGWVAHLKSFILGNDEDEDGESRTTGVTLEPEEAKALAARRTWAFDQLLNLARSSTAAKDDELIAGLLEFFAVLGWFDVRKSGKGARSYAGTPGFTESLRLAARSRFFSILTNLLPAPISASKGAASNATPTTPWLERALGLFENLEADKKHFEYIDEVDEDVASLRQQVKGMYAQLSATDERSRTARLLVEAVVLLSFDEGEDSVESLEGLTDALPLLFPDNVTEVARDSNGAKQDMVDEDEGEEPEPATVLVDLLLELLHRPSAFVKGVAQHSFVGFSDDLGPQAMELLLEQIRPEVAEAEGVDADGDASMAREPSATATIKKGASAPSVESDDEDDLDSEDEDFDVDEDFKNELLAALQESGVADEIEANAEAAEKKADDAESSDEEELLDDDAMLALDDKLADIFRLQAGKTGGRRNKKLDRTDDMHFRLRILDLIDALAKQRSSSSLLVLVLIPLLGIVRSSSPLEMELQTKAGRTLRAIVQSKREITPLPTPDAALEALEELHQIAAGVEFAEFASLCSQTAIYLVRAALTSPGAVASTSSTISTLFGDRFAEYLSKKNSKTKVQPTLTVDFARRSPACAWPLFGPVVDLTRGDRIVNAFRRIQAFEVAHTLITSYAQSKVPEAKTNLLKALPTYNNALLSTLSSATNPEISTPSFDANRLKDLIKFALAGVRLTKNLEPTKVSEIWNRQSWVEAGEALKNSERFKRAGGVHNSLKQLIAVIGEGEAKKEGEKKGKGKKRKAQVQDAGGEVEVEVEDDEDVTISSVAPALSEHTLAKKSKKDSKKKRRA